MWVRRLSVFLGALILYLICLDRGASLWDCPEYILVAWRLEVGHPPGNPTWQLVANVLSHLGGSAHHAAVIINAMSAVAMALAATFLSGVSYILLRASLFRGRGRSTLLWANVCAACGALCYAWCDSAIFSAVEAEVYALSAMFTSLMLLLALKWAVKRSRGEIAASRRIIILVFYLAGLGVGVHELNFLILPAIALIFWYGVRRYPIPRSEKRRLRLDGVPTFLLSSLLFCIGACTYFIIPIRAAANPPVNQGNPYNLERFISYYLRDQYGSKPLLYGRTPYSEPLLLEEVDSLSGEVVATKRSIRELSRGRREYVFPEELDMWFPRMTSGDPGDIEFYEKWTGMYPDKMIEVKASVVDSAGHHLGRLNPLTGEREMRTAYRPTYGQQARYLLKYQIGYMYMRYLLWNFAGRQNNIPATGEIDHGNFITGFQPVDDAMLGDQSKLDPEIRELNRGFNRYFLIPLLFGIIGIVALLASGRPGRRVCLIVFTFFIFTGLLIVVYLNQNPGEPRERDYSFLGSYMAFTIWISAGMAAVVRALLKAGYLRGRRLFVSVLAALICGGIPLQILSQTFDDHDRSHVKNAEAVIEEVLSTVPQGAIVLADGDNLIFPLWYAQEVLGVRHDITVVVVPYLSTDWYREQLRAPGEGAPGILLSEKIPPGTGGITNRALRDLIRLNGCDRPIYSASRIRPAVRIDPDSISEN